MTRSSAVAKRPRDASCLYSFYTLELCGYPMVKKIEHMFIRFDMIYEREKIAVFTYSRTAAHIFVSPGDAPATITQYVLWMERQFNACQTPRSMYLSIFNSFRVIRCLIQCVSPKIAIFYHIFVSPGDAPGAITLSVVVMERDGPVLSMSCPVLVILFSGSRPGCTPGWILYTSLFTI